MSKPKASPKSKKTNLVVVRTRSAGVHCGTLSGRNGQEVTLTDARRIWLWNGALSLHEVAASGIAGGKVSVVASSILLLQAIEVIPMAPEAMRKIASFEVK